MRTPNSGQSSRRPGDDRKHELPGRWSSVRPDALWPFAVDLVAEHTLRRAARLVGLGVETVRKFTLRKGEPNLRTRRRLAELYLALHPEVVMTQDEGTGKWKTRPRLITYLPAGRLEARHALLSLFTLAKQHALPLELDRLHEWMDLQVVAEYDAKEHFDAIARGEKEHDPGSAWTRKPGKKRKTREAEDGDEEDPAGE